VNTDVILVIGMVLAVLVVPSFLSAWSDERSVRPTALVALTALALVVFAYVEHPGGYGLRQIPNTVFRVLAMIVR